MSSSNSRPPAVRAHTFQGALRGISGLGLSAEEQTKEEVIVTRDGKTVRIEHSGRKYSIPAEASVRVPSDGGLVATLFSKNGGISELIIFEFVRTIDSLMVPYSKSPSSHRLLDGEGRVAEIVFASMPKMLEIEDLRRHEEIWGFEKQWEVEIVLQRNDVFRKHKRLAVFDMDSTLIQQEVIDEIAKFVGVEKEVSAITACAMDGELDFTQSLQKRAKLLKGVPTTVYEDLKKVITFTPGVRTLCKMLKALGFKLAVLSGGFQPLAEYVKQELGLDYAYANNLVADESGKELTGELTGEIVNAERKEYLLKQITKENGIALCQTIAVGDGANDLKMMHAAGMGVAFHAKPTVQEAAPSRINSETLQDLMYVLGFSKGEQDQLLALQG